MTANPPVPAESADSFEDIDKFIEDKFPFYIALLGELCAQPSVASLQHHRKSLDETARLIAAMLEERDFMGKTLATKGHPLLFATLGYNAEKPTLLSFNSYELQAAEEMDEWQRTMFGLTERDGMLYGHGIADNKANFVARLAAVDAWRTARGELPVNFKFLIEGRNPTEPTDFTPTLEKHIRDLRADGCLWDSGEVTSDGRTVVGLGTKGFLMVELESRTLAQAAPSAAAGVFPSAAWRLVWALSQIKSEHEEILIDGIENSVNVPTAEDSRFLMKTMGQHGARLQERLSQFEQSEYLMDLQGLPLLITEFFTPTANITWVEGGESSKPELVNVAKARLDFRLVPDQDPDEIFDLLCQHLQSKDFGDIQVRRVGSGEKPARTATGHPFVKKVLDSIEQTTGQAPLVIPLAASAGVLPQFKAALKDLPVVICGTEYPGSSRNTVSEHIRRSDFIAHTKWMTRLLAAFDKENYQF